MQTEPLRWNVVQRYAFLEQRLYWEGRVQKADLIKRFGISAPQATIDVVHYHRLFPANLAYDSKVKAFVAGEDFEPNYMRPDARTYLSQLLLLADAAINPADSWLGVVPSHAAIPKVRRRLEPDVLRRIVRAIQNRQAIRVCYQSMNTPEPTERWIAPHGLAFDGFRWHARVWCYKHSSFLDLVLARFTLTTDDKRPAEIDGSLDREWNDIVAMRLAPHPDLSPGQQRAIELDYGMENGTIDVPMRVSLTWYFERHLCLDIDGLKPERQQVVLLNRAEVELARNPKIDRG
ncbi:WYL domain-containing protein [Pseudolysobacter antarcticus]|uniref:WYL domain-containing protein n=1 Tax=Pseudolysobacter antarcticus TaxID=2511995 RepID=A0A411HFS3_9GAMM|nr:WYL domain-containing protein [Pseudolysobacter antarcticus]QBB69346.1 WYL domain-containing protein [Pseudolysobacter antarcticus]